LPSNSFSTTRHSPEILFSEAASEIYLSLLSDQLF
jgi:hypothetical protein